MDHAKKRAVKRASARNDAKRALDRAEKELLALIAHAPPDREEQEKARLLLESAFVRVRSLYVPKLRLPVTGQGG